LAAGEFDGGGTDVPGGVAGTLSSPVTVSGTADVFEAMVSVRILDSAGNQIARTFSTASCGTGCRGRYSIPVMLAP
jgi:Immunoglobulin-like domain of bacterial spore germination